MTKKIATMIQAILLVMFVQGCWASEAVNNKSSSESNSNKDVTANVVSSEGNKKGEDNYSPISYELKWSKEDSVCKDLLAVVNNDLKYAPYVDYADTKHFMPWEVLKHGSEMQKDIGQWMKTYKPPVARRIIDIDNDGDLEYLYMLTYLDPLAKQSIYILKNQPKTEPKIVEDPMAQSSLFWAFVKAEQDAGNTVGEGIWIRRLMRLEELPEYSDKNRLYFEGEVASFFIYKHQNRNYLVADTLNYNPKSERWYENNPWLLLFSVSNEGQLRKTCILKRAR